MYTVSQSNSIFGSSYRDHLQELLGTSTFSSIGSGKTGPLDVRKHRLALLTELVDEINKLFEDGFAERNDGISECLSLILQRKNAIEQELEEEATRKEQEKQEKEAKRLNKMSDYLRMYGGASDSTMSAGISPTGRFRADMMYTMPVRNPDYAALVDTITELTQETRANDTIGSILADDRHPNIPLPRGLGVAAEGNSEN